MTVPACSSCGTTKLPLDIWKDAIQHADGTIEPIDDSAPEFFCANCSHKVRDRANKPTSFEKDDLMPHERRRQPNG
jgi:hypothetical protein